MQLPIQHVHVQNMSSLECTMQHGALHLLQHRPSATASHATILIAHAIVNMEPCGGAQKPPADTAGHVGQGSL
jgi:hypothetical protein